MKTITALLISIISLFFNACTSHQVEPKIDLGLPAYVKSDSKANCEMIKTVSNEGSIYSSGTTQLFSDKKAMRINDIVTVIINESAFQSSQGDKKLTDTSVNNLGGGIFGGVGAGVGAGLGKNVNTLTDISFKTNSNNNFSASGTQSRNEKFKATITARVVRILGNGNYFIAGSRELLLNGTKQIVKITGVIRPFDIDQSNTINSKYIADARIYYETQGDIRESTRKPWGSRMIESVWPF